MRRASTSAQYALDEKIIENVVAETVAKSLPTVLARFLSSGGLVPPTIATQLELASSEQPKDTGVNLPSTSRGDRFFSENKKTKVSAELLDLTTKSFSKALSVEKWKELIDSYPPIEGADSILIAPTMEAGMKEDLRNRHGYQKTKEVLAFDEGLSEKQASYIYICVARPILSALSALDAISEDGEARWPRPRHYQSHVGRCLGNDTYSLISSMNEYVVNMITVRQIRRLSANPKNLARDSTVPSPFTTRALPEGPHKTPLPSEGGLSTTSELDSTRKPKPESDPVPPPDLITVDNYCFPVLETINQPSSIAAQLGHFKRIWMTLTQDPWIQQTVSGYKIPFTSPPQQWRPGITRATQLEMKQNLLTAINSLISKGAVKEVASHLDEFLSTLFLVEKQDKSGEY